MGWSHGGLTLMNSPSHEATNVKLHGTSPWHRSAFSSAVINFRAPFMSQTTREKPKKRTRRRRWVPWVFGAVAVLLLLVIASQQLWLWNVIQPDTASDTLVLYALSTLNFVAFVVFSFIFIRSLLDRKSTRLNSSHDQISYAVFCLK